MRATFSPPAACLLALLTCLPGPGCSGDSARDCVYDTHCPGSKICVDGRCVVRYPPDCPDRECAEGFVCIDGSCVETACIDVSCPEGEACAAGRCYPRDCRWRTCPGLGEVCIEEKCVPPSCVDVTCPQGQLCAVGRCYPIDCETKKCPGYGEVCIEGDCVQRTCVGVTCPPGQRCARGECFPQDCEDLTGAGRFLYFAERIGIGGAWSEPERMFDAAWFPSMDSDASGQLHMMFWTMSGGERAVCWRRRANGNWQRVTVSTSRALKTMLHVHAAGDGWLHGVFAQWTPQEKHHVFYAIGDASTGLWGEPVQISRDQDCHAPNSCHLPRVAVTPGGWAHVVWVDETGHEEGMAYHALVPPGTASPP